MKKAIIALILLLAATTAQAATISFTTDNQLTGFSIYDGTTTYNPLGTAAVIDNDWKSINTVNFDFLSGTTYTLTWDVHNWENPAYTPTGSGPMAFIGKIVDSVLTYTSGTGAEWSYTDLDSATDAIFWTTALGSGAWGSSLGTAAALLAGASWVGYSGATDDMRVTLTFTTAATPVPAAVWMLGSGLLALVGVRRRLA